MQPFLRKFPGRTEFLLASIDLRDMHPDFESERYEQVGGVTNPTRYQLALPNMACYTGWSLNGYAIESRWIPKWTEEVPPPPGPPEQLVQFAYALKYRRPEDGLVRVGYDVIDGNFDFLSIAHNCGYSVADLMRLSGDTLNEFGLFRSADVARTFISTTGKEEPDESHLEKPVIVEVWGDPDTAGVQALGSGIGVSSMDADDSAAWMRPSTTATRFAEKSAVRKFLVGAVAPLLIASMVTVYVSMRASGRPFSEEILLTAFPYEVMCVIYLLLYPIARIRAQFLRAACGTSIFLMLVVMFLYGSASSSSTGGIAFMFLPTCLLLVGQLVFYSALIWLCIRNRRLRQREASICSNCGYRLIGLTEPRCPECAEPCDPAMITTHERPREPGSR
jgi:hypothetical protein